VEYSWREWDLLNNREARVLRVCQSSFENVDGTARQESLSVPWAAAEPGGAPNRGGSRRLV